MVWLFESFFPAAADDNWQSSQWNKYIINIMVSQTTYTFTSYIKKRRISAGGAKKE